MPPAGDFLSGMGLMGMDPSPPAPAPRTATTPVALWWDAASRDYLLDANGFFKSLHPVDQKMGLALTTRKGTISSVPGQGARFTEIVFAAGPALGAQVNDFVKQATADIVAAGEAQILSVSFQTPQSGSIAIQVSYVNLVTGKPQTFPPK